MAKNIVRFDLIPKVHKHSVSLQMRTRLKGKYVLFEDYVQKLSELETKLNWYKNKLKAYQETMEPENYDYTN